VTVEVFEHMPVNSKLSKIVATPRRISVLLLQNDPATWYAQLETAEVEAGLSPLKIGRTQEEPEYQV
jgi:hypothetical protein